MKKLLTLGILLVACAVSMGQTNGAGGLRPGTQPERFQDMTGTYTDGYRAVTDGLARFAVRFDDGRDDQYDIVIGFLRRSIPVSLSVNLSNLGTGGNMTVAQVQALQAIAASNGTQLEILQHTATSWGGSGTPQSDLPDYDDMLAELDPTALRAAFGEVRTYINPGEGSVGAWISTHYGIFKSLCDSLGLEFAVWGTANPDSSGIYTAVPEVAASIESGTSGVNSMRQAIRPGIYDDPHHIPEGWTVDLNSSIKFVERDSTVFDIADTWSVRSKEPGKTLANDAKFGFRWWIGTRLGNNLGAMIAGHDSVSSQGYNSASTGAFSWDAIASMLRAYEDAGHLKLVTVSEWCEWAMGKYARGVDLVSNSGLIVPHLDILDTLGVDVPFPRGMSTAGWAYTGPGAAQTGGALPYTGLAVNAVQQKLNLYQDVYGVAGEGYRKSGALLVKAAHPNSKRVLITFGCLSPGRYLLTWAIDNDGASPQFLDFWQMAQSKRALLATSFGASGKFSYSDSQFVYKGTDNVTNMIRPGVWNEKWSSYSMPVYLPADLGFKWSPGEYGADATTLDFWWYERPVHMISMRVNHSGDLKWADIHLFYLGD